MSNIFTSPAGLCYSLANQRAICVRGDVWLDLNSQGRASMRRPSSRRLQSASGRSTTYSRWRFRSRTTRRTWATAISVRIQSLRRRRRRKGNIWAVTDDRESQTTHGDTSVVMNFYGCWIKSDRHCPVSTFLHLFYYTPLRQSREEKEWVHKQASNALPPSECYMSEVLNAPTETPRAVFDWGCVGYFVLNSERIFFKDPYHVIQSKGVILYCM